MLSARVARLDAVCRHLRSRSRHQRHPRALGFPAAFPAAFSSLLNAVFRKFYIILPRIIAACSLNVFAHCAHISPARIHLYIFGQPLRVRSAKPPA